MYIYIYSRVDTISCFPFLSGVFVFIFFCFFCNCIQSQKWWTGISRPTTRCRRRSHSSSRYLRRRQIKYRRRSATAAASSSTTFSATYSRLPPNTNPQSCQSEKALTASFGNENPRCFSRLRSCRDGFIVFSYLFLILFR